MLEVFEGVRLSCTLWLARMQADCREQTIRQKAENFVTEVLFVGFRWLGTRLFAEENIQQNIQKKELIYQYTFTKFPASPQRPSRPTHLPKRLQVASITDPDQPRASVSSPSVTVAG